MKMKRILALTLAAWMVCSTAVNATDFDPENPPKTIKPDAHGGYIQEIYVHEIAVNSDPADDVSVEPPVDYIKIDTQGMPPEDVKIVAEERGFNFYAGDTIHLPHAGSFVTIAKGDSSRRKAVFAMNTTVNQAVADKYPHANLTFLNGNGGTFGKGATMHIAAGGRKYLYKFVALDYGISGEPDLSSTYNAEQDAFIFPAETLDSYILSDVDLTDEQETNVSWMPVNSVGSKTNILADDLKNRYKNDFALVSYGTKFEKMGKTAEFTIKTWSNAPSRLHATSLRVYAYDEKTDKLLRMPNAKPAYSSRTKSYRFTSDYRGIFVITDSGWMSK